MLGGRLRTGPEGILADGDPSRRILAAVAGVWSARLALHVFFNRVYGKPEDGRYQTLRAT